MKTILLVAHTLLFAPRVFAAHVIRQSVSVDELRKEMTQLSAELANADGCKFFVEDARGVLTLQVLDERQKTATLAIQDGTAVTLEVPMEKADGSFVRIFRMSGKRVVQITFADDAFERVDLTDQYGQELSCELDI